VTWKSQISLAMYRGQQPAAANMLKFQINLDCKFAIMFSTSIAIVLHDVRAHLWVCKRMDPLLNDRMLYKVCKNKNYLKYCVFVSVLRRTTSALGVIYFLLAQVKRNRV
jgi:hypothetical protein